MLIYFSSEFNSFIYHDKYLSIKVCEMLISLEKSFSCFGMLKKKTRYGTETQVSMGYDNRKQARFISEDSTFAQLFDEWNERKGLLYYEAEQLGIVRWVVYFI